MELYSTLNLSGFSVLFLCNQGQQESPAAPERSYDDVACCLFVAEMRMPPMT
jgi:hypothetical protein